MGDAASRATYSSKGMIAGLRGSFAAVIASCTVAACGSEQAQEDPAASARRRALDHMPASGHLDGERGIFRYCPPISRKKPPTRSQLVGSSLARGKLIARRYGYRLRVVRRDGEDLVVPLNLDPRRFNVVVRGGRITHVLGRC